MLVGVSTDWVLRLWYFSLAFFAYYRKICLSYLCDTFSSPQTSWFVRKSSEKSSCPFNMLLAFVNKFSLPSICPALPRSVFVKFFVSYFSDATGVSGQVVNGFVQWSTSWIDPATSSFKDRLASGYAASSSKRLVNNCLTRVADPTVKWKKCQEKK